MSNQDTVNERFGLLMTAIIFGAVILLMYMIVTTEPPKYSCRNIFDDSYECKMYNLNQCVADESLSFEECLQLVGSNG